MNIKNRQAIRLYDSLSAVAGSEEAKSVLEKLPLPGTPSNGKKREWVFDLCRELRERYDERTVCDIRQACHCKPSPPQVKKLKELWQKSGGDLSAFAALANAKDGAFALETDGKTLTLCYPTCYCSFAKHCEKPFPVEWCYCTLGYAEEMFGEVFERPVAAELLESVMTGSAACRIRVVILP